MPNLNTLVQGVMNGRYAFGALTVPLMIPFIYTQNYKFSSITISCQDKNVLLARLNSLCRLPHLLFMTNFLKLLVKRYLA